jgi:hypothetical protein
MLLVYDLRYEIVFASDLLTIRVGGRGLIVENFNGSE